MSYTAREIANLTGADLAGDPEARVNGVAAPENATAADLIFVASANSAAALMAAEKSAARCVIVPRGMLLPDKTCLQAQDSRLAFAKAASYLLPVEEIVPGRHATAIIAPSAVLEEDVAVGPYAVVGAEATVGRGTEIAAFCFIGPRVRIGTECRLHPRVTLYAGTQVGNRVVIHAGTVIGGDGFGYVFGEGRYWKFPQIGTVVIGDDSEIGCNAAIDRGALGRTQVGAGTKIDNLVHIAHNVEIGPHSVIAAQSGISGSSRLGAQVTLGGQVGVADHCVIEDRAVIGAQSGVATGKRVVAGDVVWGSPARPLERAKKQFAFMARFPEILRRLRELERAVGTQASSRNQSARC